MTTQLIITVTGPDRPGLVEAVSDVLARHGANWEESRMAGLHGRFAGLLSARVDAQAADALVSDLQSLASNALALSVHPVPTTTTQPDAPPYRAELDLVGNDRPGIVQAIAHALHELGVSVDELHTDVSDATLGGGQLFRAVAHLSVPDRITLVQVQSTLEALANELMVDVRVIEDTD